MALVAGGLTAWGILVATGLCVLWRHAEQPGKAGDAPNQWPAALARAEDRPSLLVFLHPKCPCSRASVSELARLAAHVPDRLQVTAVFVVPAGETADWAHGALWDATAEIPGLARVIDHEGKLATQFGAQTSGYALLYAPDGRRLFAGGITSARGHEGDNDGRSAIEALALSENSTVHATPVFGCVLDAPAAGGS
jgi:hypothetical protein